MRARAPYLTKDVFQCDFRSLRYLKSAPGTKKGADESHRHLVIPTDAFYRAPKL